MSGRDMRGLGAALLLMLLGMLAPAIPVDGPAGPWVMGAEFLLGAVLVVIVVRAIRRPR